MTYILGISAYYHDSSISIIKDGNIIFCAQEERYSRLKHDSKFPIKSLRFALNYLNLNFNDFDHIVFYDKPLLKFERILETFLSIAPKGFSQFKIALPTWIKEKFFLKYLLIKELKKFDKDFSSKKLLFTEHHISHLSSAYYPSPHSEAIILSIDGVGEWATTTIAIGRLNKIEIIKELHYPHSLGLLYSAFTQYLGFKVNSGEYKVMGLAPYGQPKYYDLICQKLIDIKSDGSFRLNMKYFNFLSGLSMINKQFENIFDNPKREYDSNNLNQFHMDIAASIQKIIEDVVVKISTHAQKEYNIENLCLSGGVALNCVANSKILNKKIFKNIWIQPASGDAGGSLGAALYCFYQYLKNDRSKKLSDIMQGAYLGQSYSDEQIEKEIKNQELIFDKYTEEELVSKTATLISESNVIGWFQGRMEFGPRSLGCRSILADPRSDEMQKVLNLKIKFRESFRPFAPSILEEFTNEWFEFNEDSPYMLQVANIKESKKLNISDKNRGKFGLEKLYLKRSLVPAITHVDYSARLQTVNKNQNYLFHKLLSKFNQITKVPILINTSFNVRGEPIVNSPLDAIKCFCITDIDYLVIGSYIISKKKQNKNLKNKFEYFYQPD